jgi:opacity protein-like surface antigen
MKTRSYLILAGAISLGLLCLPETSSAQWEVGANFSLALPITGYGEVFKLGHGFGVEGKYHFRRGFGVGFESGFARFTKTKELSIPVNEPKITVIPIIFTAEYELNNNGFVRPFFSGGLGLSIYTFSYYTDDPVDSENRANVSFTMSPQAGVRFAFTKNVMYYIKGSYVLLMDGPPVVMEDNAVLFTFPKSDQATGYAGISFGFNYRFN